MRTVIQRVSEASVTIDGNLKSEIKTGLLVLLGVGVEDSKEDITWLVNKIVNLRVFPSETGNVDKSIQDVNGEILVISQFTLFASTKKGNRPSFLNSAKPEIAKPLYLDFVKALEEKINKKVGTGVFGADMKVALVNDGPITISIDTKNKE